MSFSWAIFWVVLYKSCCAHDPMILLTEPPAWIKAAEERDGRESRMSSLWFQTLQEQWSFANWAAEPALPGVWAPICPPRGQSGDQCRTTDLGRTLTLREHLSAWHVPGWRGQYPRAPGL